MSSETRHVRLQSALTFITLLNSQNTLINCVPTCPNLIAQIHPMGKLMLATERRFAACFFLTVVRNEKRCILVFTQTLWTSTCTLLDTLM